MNVMSKSKRFRHVGLGAVAIAVLSMAALPLQGEDDGSDGRVRPEERLKLLTPWEQWSGLKAHPAVVNPVVRADAANTLSLRGDWDFRTTRQPTYGNSPSRATVRGCGGFWSKEGGVKSRDGELRSISVPGCWEMQGVGSAATSQPCFVKWDVSPKPMRHCYQGVGWYRKSVEIPATWTEKRVWLKTGWANSAAKFWVNGEPVAYENTFCGTYKYDVSEFVTPGSTATVVVEVMNAVPSRRGGYNSVNHWGGILRDIEFEATPVERYIDDAWVRGDFDRQVAEVHVELDGVEFASSKFRVQSLKLKVTVEGETVEQSIEQSKQSNSQAILEVPLRNFRAWSPEHPNLYTAEVELVSADGKVLQSRLERFGVRKLEVRGEDFFLNGKPFYMRGAGWHFVHPVEGAPLADREIWLAKARKVRAAGFNIVRTHTMCNMPEFYEACDETGLMVEPELPYYTDVPRDGQAFDPVGDARELYEHFRRHPSFCVYSGGNEGWFGARLTRWLFQDVKTRDPDRLMVGQDTWMNDTNNQRGMSDYSGGPMTVWPRGTVRSEGRPFVCHEYLNLCIKLDSRLESKYTGVYEAPVTRACRAEWLKNFGLGQAWGDDLQDAQNALQSVWRKYGFEAARTDPHCDGYSYWSLQDYASPQKGSYTAQALFDPFWDVKPRGDSAADVAVYNSASCLLLSDGADPELWEKPGRKLGSFEMFADGIATNRVRSSGELIRARFHLAHYGEEPLDGASLRWRLRADGRDLASGELAVGRQALGASRVVGSVDIRVPDVDRACRAVLAADLGGVTNSWPYWLFPARKRPAAGNVACADAFRGALSPRYDGMLAERDWNRADVVIAPFGSDLERRALAAGKRVVALANQTGKADVFLGWWWMGDQMGAAIKDHPALEAFPHQGILNPLFFRIGKTGLRLPVEGVAEKDLIMVGEGAEACFLYLADVPMPNGARRFLIAGLDVLSDTPEGKALLDGVVRGK